MLHRRTVDRKTGAQRSLGRQDLDDVVVSTLADGLLPVSNGVDLSVRAHKLDRGHEWRGTPDARVDTFLTQLATQLHTATSTGTGERSRPLDVLESAILNRYGHIRP